MGKLNHEQHDLLDKMRPGPSLGATVVHTAISALIIWTILVSAISFVVPIDSTGSVEGDATNAAKVPWVLAATAVGTVSLTALHITRWRRKKN